MAIELVCSCGQVLRFDGPPPGGQVRCPDCNKVLTMEDDRSILATLTDLPTSRGAPPAATRKPLWQVMARDQEGLAAPQQPGGENAKETLAYDTEPVPPGAASSGPSAGRKGLWSLMQKSEIPAPNQSASNTDSPSHSVAAMFGIAADEALMSAQNKAAGFEAENSRRALAAAVMGGLSIPLSGLALVNAAWSRLPATALGFIGILTGLIASQEIERSAGRKTGRRLAMTGIVTGIVGAFLGPLVIAPFGRPKKDR